MDSDQITSDFVSSLPKQTVKGIEKKESTAVIPEKDESAVEQVTQEAQVGNWSNVQDEEEDKEHTEEPVYTEEPLYTEEQPEEPLYTEEQTEEPLYTEEQTYTEEQSYVEEQPYAEEERYEEKGQGEGPQRKKPRYHHPQAPPAPPVMPQDEGLSNLMMAWYYAGYYTGLYQVSFFLFHCPSVIHSFL
jgi:hypothetical protein